MPIDHIRIRNFRSLADVSLPAKELTVFVGCNDEGKSNLLRALDSFFNAPRGTFNLSWDRDFSGFAKVPKNKARQIEVTLTFSLPLTFKNREPVTWTRIWRQTGLYEDSTRLADGSSLPSRNKVDHYLRSIRYEY